MHNYEVAKADVDSTTSTSCFLPTMDRGLHNIDGCWHIIAYSLQILNATRVEITITVAQRAGTARSCDLGHQPR